MKISPKTSFINIPLESNHFKVHGIIQICLGGLFAALGNAYLPLTLYWVMIFGMIGIGFLTFSRHLEVRELITDLSSVNTFSVTHDWIKANCPNQESLYLGKGYLWGTDCTQIYHQLLNLPALESIVDLEPEGGGKVFLHNVRKEKQKHRFLKLPEHTIIAGTTGVGKTAAMLLLSTQIIHRGESVIIIDPKGDRHLLDGVYKAAVQAGRKDDFQFFSLLHPTSSYTFDLFADCMRADEIADRVQSLIAQTGGAETADPFLAFCWGLIHATADLLLITKEKVTPARLYRALVTHKDELLEIANVMYSRSNSQNEKRAIRDAMDLYRAKVIEHDETHSAKMTTVLHPLLTVLGRGEIGALLSADVAHIQMPDVISNKRIVYIYLASMTLQRASASVGKLIVQNIVGHIGKEYGFSKKLHGVHLFVDEFYSVAFPGYIEILAKARAAGLFLYLGMQTSADIAATLGKTGCEQVVGNTANFLCMRIPERTIAEVIADRCGEVAVPQLIKTRSINAGMDKADHLFKSGSTERLDMSMTLRVSPEMLTSLPIGEAFLISSGKMPIKLTLPLLQDSGDPIESFFERLNPEKPFVLQQEEVA